MRGRRLTEEGIAPRARLDGQTLPIRSFSQSHIDIDLPGDRGGILELDLPDGTVETFEIAMPEVPQEAPPEKADSWSDPSGSADNGEDSQ